jgi:hypothetical protein
MSVGLKFGRKRFLAAMACKPYDSLEQLLGGLTAIVRGGTEAIVHWNEEPEEFDFVFRRADGELELAVVRYASHKRKGGEVIFRAAGSVSEIVSAFWDTFRELKEDLATDEFTRNWRRPFPAAEYAELEQAIKT